jgi:hypothetical protein
MSTRLGRKKGGGCVYDWRQEKGSGLNGTNLRRNPFCDRSLKNLLTCHVSLGVFSNSREKRYQTSPDFLSSFALFASWR